MKGIHTLWPLGIRLQLMLCYSAVFAALMLLSAALLYTRLQATLASSLDTALQLQAQQVAGDIPTKREPSSSGTRPLNCPVSTPATASCAFPLPTSTWKHWSAC